MQLAVQLPDDTASAHAVIEAMRELIEFSSSGRTARKPDTLLPLSLVR